MHNKQAVIAMIEQASSQDPTQVAQAEQSLGRWETKPMFYATLFDIFADRSLPMQVRWLAIINLKNGVEKYWKKTAQHAIQIEEKELVRPRLLDVLDEENPQIAVQYCVTISRIARWEFPRVWPEFIDVLMARIKHIAVDSGSAARGYVTEHNALYTLHLFIKTLCQRTLAAERQAFRRLTPMVFCIVAPIYAERIRQFNEVLRAGNGSELHALLKSIRLCIKTLRRLLVFGYEKIEEADPAAQEFYMATAGHQAAFYKLFADLSAEHRDSADGLVLRKIVLLYGKLYLEFQKYHALRFITMSCVKPMLAWYWAQIQSEAPKMISSPTDPDSAQELTLEPLLIQGLELYKNVVKNFFYVIDEGVEDKDSAVKRCRQVIDNDILVPAFITQMAVTLINFYIPLKARDLEKWEDDPEAWLVEEDSDYWAFDVRRSAERLFVDIVDQNRSLMVPELVNMLQQGVIVANTDAAFYQREGLYSALGLCANQIYDGIDFCQWLKEHPVIDSPMGVVKWRIAWLIGKWVPVKLPVEERGYAYSVLLQLAQRGEPLIVRMEALGSLLLCVDDWDFNAEQFAPYLEASIESITSVLGDVNMAESRMRIVNFLSTLVCRMQREIVPFAENIVKLIPPLWQSAAQENLYQTTILSLVTKLVEALGAQSVVLQQFIAPLVQHSIDLNDPAHVYLIEDGLELWLALVRNASALDPSIMALLQNIPSLLQYGTETLRKILKIIESYVLIDGAGIFAESGLMLLCALNDLVSDNKLAARAIAAGYTTLHVIVQCVPMEACAQPLTQSNLLWTAFTRIVDKRETAQLLIYHAVFMSRLAVHYPALFGEFLASQDASLSSTFTENWIDLYDDVGQITQRRLYAISLAVAIATTNDGILKNLPSMVPIWNDIISDTGSSLVYFSDVDDDMPEGYGEVMVAENQRRQKMLSSDPAHKFDIKEVLAQSIAECERLNGPERFQAIVAQIDVVDLEDLKNQLS
ncbi:hypothetical protein GGF37_002927 [Kickxella alabastrina]|nr:hypothetical protein GGF37_002927 [Kickxella alabastrina]